MEQDGETQVEDEIHQLDTNSTPTVFTKEEHDNACLERGEMPPKESEDFRRGYQLGVLNVQRQIGLRNRDVPTMRNKDARNKASTSKYKNDSPPKDSSKNVTDPKGK